MLNDSGNFSVSETDKYTLMDTKKALDVSQTECYNYIQSFGRALTFDSHYSLIRYNHHLIISGRDLL